MPNPLPTLYIARKGFKCLDPHCIHALVCWDNDGLLVCCAGHRFDVEGGREFTYRELVTWLQAKGERHGEQASHSPEAVPAQETLLLQG